MRPEDEDPTKPFFPRIDQEVTRVAYEHGVAEDAERVYRHRPSNASACTRNLAYGALGAPFDPTSGRSILIFDDGDIHEDATARWLGRSKYPVTSRQLSLDVMTIEQPEGLIPTEICKICGESIPGNVVHGHIDGLIHTSTESFLHEHKALSHWTVEAITKDGEPPLGYVTQGCLYILGCQEAGMVLNKAILIIKNKNSAAYLQFSIEYDAGQDHALVIDESTGRVMIFDDIVKSYREKCDAVVKAMVTQELPERPYEIDSWHCRYCPRMTLCWESYGDELAMRQGEVEIEPESDLGQLLVETRTARDLRDTNEALQRDLGRQAKRMMKDRDIRSGRVGDLHFWEGSMNGRETIDQSKIPADILALALTRGQPFVTLHVQPTRRGKKESSK